MSLRTRIVGGCLAALALGFAGSLVMASAQKKTAPPPTPTISRTAPKAAPRTPPKAAPKTAPRVLPKARLLNLNTATVAELDGLPTIGPKTAARIVEYRQEHGSFKKIEQLMNVRGVGEKSFLKLKDRITVGPAHPTGTSHQP